MSENEQPNETLHRAAAWLWARARLATDPPWEASRGPVEDLHFGVVEMTQLEAPSKPMFAVAGLSLADGEYMAMMHPPVARALAEMLRVVSEQHGPHVSCENAGCRRRGLSGMHCPDPCEEAHEDCAQWQAAQAVARAILREKDNNEVVV